VTAPFVKMAGGKRQLLPEILKRLPATISRYYEPFVGGGAVFFALALEGRFKRATLSDVNAELVNTYQVVATPDARPELMERLRRLPWSQDGYYRTRASNPRSPIARAARFIYLNRAGFNGLWRVNSKGQCNVPFGHHAKSPINGRLFVKLYAAGAVLEQAQIIQGDFRTLWRGSAGPRKGDVVYCDPPYLPAGEAKSFAAYDASGFGVKETEALAEHALRWSKRGAHVLLSNADTPEVRRIFAGFQIERVTARRSINRNGAGRGSVGELLIQPRGQS